MANISGAQKACRIFLYFPQKFKKELKMRITKTFLILALMGFAFVGCSNSRQHKDPSWTAKPANMQVVFTAPVIMDTEKDSDGSNDWPIFPWYYTSENRLPAAGPSALPIATKDSLMLPDEMKKMSEWFSSNVDNTLKFNSNVHYKVSEISKDEVSYSEQVADGENIRVPMPKSMDSAEVYMVLDSIYLKSYVSMRPCTRKNHPVWRGQFPSLFC